MESDNSAAVDPVCTCGEDLARNGGFVHNYLCPLTPKCQHVIMRMNTQTGQMGQSPCGSRLEPQYASHGHGCPCLPLCPHCGTSMDRRGVHSIGCPNRLNYSFVNSGNSRNNIRLSDDFEYLEYEHGQLDHSNFQNLVQRLINVMQVMPVIPASQPPAVIDGDFEIKGQCSVCQDECEQSQRVLKPADCDHCFHSSCLMPWIRDHSTCPNCRGKIQTILRKN